MAHTFVELNHYSTNADRLARARGIRCPQEQRLYLRN